MLENIYITLSSLFGNFTLLVMIFFSIGPILGVLLLTSFIKFKKVFFIYSFSILLTIVNTIFVIDMYSYSTKQYSEIVYKATIDNNNTISFQDNNITKNFKDNLEKKLEFQLTKLEFESLTNVEIKEKRYKYYLMPTYKIVIKNTTKKVKNEK